MKIFVWRRRHSSYYSIHYRDDAWSHFWYRMKVLKWASLTSWKWSGVLFWIITYSKFHYLIIVEFSDIFNHDVQCHFLIKILDDIMIEYIIDLKIFNCHSRFQSWNWYNRSWKILNTFRLHLTRDLIITLKNIRLNIVFLIYEINEQDFFQTDNTWKAFLTKNHHSVIYFRHYW